MNSNNQEEIYYFNEDGKIVENLDEATNAIIREVDQSGNTVQETYGEFRDDDPRIVELTQEEYDEYIAEGGTFMEGMYRIVSDKKK